MEKKRVKLKLTGLSAWMLVIYAAGSMVYSTSVLFGMALS